MPSTFGIVDPFAGLGGLGEGFASLVTDGHAPGISVEKETSAHRSLTLRAFLREDQARHGQPFSMQIRDIGGQATPLHAA